MISISANLNIMIKAVEKASKSIIRDFGEVEKLQVSKKGPRDFVTKTDRHVEKILIEELSNTKKNYSFISFLYDLEKFFKDIFGEEKWADLNKMFESGIIGSIFILMTSMYIHNKDSFLKGSSFFNII